MIEPSVFAFLIQNADLILCGSRSGLLMLLYLSEAQLRGPTMSVYAPGVQTSTPYLPALNSIVSMLASDLVSSC